MKISDKIGLAFLIVAVTLTTITMFSFYINARNILQKAIFAHLETTAKSRSNHIRHFLKTHKKAIEQLANSVVIGHKPIKIGSQELTITVSLGVTNYKHQNNIDELMKECDDLMYKAKDKGRNRLRSNIRSLPRKCIT